MNKIIIGIAVAIIVVWSILNVGGNTSTTEGVLDLTKTSDNIAKINSAIDIVGDGVFNNLLVEVPSKFKGEVEQVPSSFITPIKTHKMRDGVILSYTSGMKVTIAGGTIQDLRLPASARNAVAEINTPGLNRPEYVSAGEAIPPVLKETNSSNYQEWVRIFVWEDEGLGLNRIDKVYADKIKALDTAGQVKLLTWIFGNGEDIDWNSFKTDRIVALRQIDVDSLTGLDKNNKTISAIVDPNRAYLYKVSHVNTVNFETLVTKVPSELGITVGEEKTFTYKIASHLNQTIGNRILIIPNNDNSQIIDADGKSIFILN